MRFRNERRQKIQYGGKRRSDASAGQAGREALFRVRASRHEERFRFRERVEMRIDAVGRTSRVCPGEPRASRRGRGRTPRVCRPSPTARRSRRSAPPCHGGSACAAPWWWESTSSVAAGSRRRRATGRGRGRNTADTAQRRARVGGRWISKIHAPQSRLDQRALRERRRGRHVSGRRATGCAPRRTRRRLFSPRFRSQFGVETTLAILYDGRDVSLYGA